MTNVPAQPGIGFAPGAAGPTPAPIHDIVGPFSFFSLQPMLVAGILIVMALVLAAVWFLRRKKSIEPTPKEAALLALDRLRGTLSEGSDHDFGVRVSDVLRRFLGEALGLAAPRQTTEEFLQSLDGSLRFLPAEREALAGFLSRSDHLKYAQGEATSEQRLGLIAAAEEFVRGGGANPPAAEALPAIPAKEAA